MPSYLKIDKLLSDIDREAFLAVARHPATTVDSAQQWLRERGCRVSFAAVLHYLNRERPGTAGTHHFLKVDKILRPEHKAEYDALLENPGTTETIAWQFLKERGYAIGRSSVALHRKRWLAELKDVRRFANLAAGLGDVGQEIGTTAFSGGALIRLDQLIMERLFAFNEQGALDLPQLGQVAKMLETALHARERLEGVRFELEREKRRAIEAASKAADDGADGRTVVERVKEILGV